MEKITKSKARDAVVRSKKKNPRVSEYTLASETPTSELPAVQPAAATPVLQSTVATPVGRKAKRKTSRPVDSDESGQEDSPPSNKKVWGRLDKMEHLIEKMLNHEVFQPGFHTPRVPQQLSEATSSRGSYIAKSCTCRKNNMPTSLHGDP